MNEFKKILDNINNIKNMDNQTMRTHISNLIKIAVKVSKQDKINKKNEIYNQIVNNLSELVKYKNNDSQEYFINTIKYYIIKDYKKYFTNMEKYIKEYIYRKKEISFKTAYWNIFYLIYNFKDFDYSQISFSEFFQNFHKIAEKYCKNSAFEIYLDFLYITEDDSNINTNIRKKYLKKVIEIDPAWAYAYIDLAYTFYIEEKWNDAVKYYETAIKTNKYSMADSDYFCLAWSFGELEEYKKEEEAYKKCLEISSNYEFANNNLGYNLKRQKKYKEAVIYFNKSIELGENGHYPYREKFDILCKLENFPEAYNLSKNYSSHFNTKECHKRTMKLNNLITDKNNENEVYSKLENFTQSDFAGKMYVAEENSRIKLYLHQQDAIKKLDKEILNKKTFSGLLVLPTGGGKTLTATYWLMQSLLDKGKKILWIAHRHELLNQAEKSFEKVCYRDISKTKKSFNWRIISGCHDKPIHIKSTDDIIISSKASLCKGIKYFNENWLEYNKDKVFLVIDEAHHAIASEYRTLINSIKEKTENFKMLGLTATPFRTSDNEQGLLKKVFTDDIVYKIDLRELINCGILSEPIFEPVATNIDMIKLFKSNDGEEVIERIAKESFFDIDSINKNLAKAIAENRDRNNIIVNQYKKNKEKYGQTIVFAQSVDMAITLNKLFIDSGIKSGYVISNIKDTVTGITISNKNNERTINAFKNQELDIIINVNILTEGTDLPKTKTVFLTRPTKSTILMTQMIGRALRGVQAGGTKEAYIVSFIDNWQNKIAWVNPEQLFIDENIDFTKDDYETQRQTMRLISIQKIEEFTKIVNGTLDERIADIDFIERVPIGIYKFSYLIENNYGDETEKNCNILAYDCMKESYDKLIEWIPTANLTDIEKISEHAHNTLFSTVDSLLGYTKDDIKDLILYYKQNAVIPEMIYLKERENFDINKLAQKIVDDPINEKKYVDEQWSKNNNQWSAFLGIEGKRAFLKIISDATNRIKYPEDFKISDKKTITQKEEIKIKELPLYEIRKKYPELGEKIRNFVFEKYRDKEGYYFSASGKYRSKNKLDFQIDHIKPMSKGGLTTLDNLQLLTKTENMMKSDN